MAVNIHIGDYRDVLATLPDESVHCVVTSPPYWGLRDYGVEGQLGLEPSPEEYLETMVDIFRDVRRVLREDGTLWLNMGDSYNSAPPGARDSERWPKQSKNDHKGIKFPVTNLKPKDLIGMPWRLALALQADGWWLRSDIIWAKPNPMPESCTDRPTKSHEHIFLMTRSPRYFYDAEAIREPGVSADRPQPEKESKTISPNDTEWHDNRYAPGVTGYGVNPSGRNKRDVWTIPTFPFSAAHFATFPPELPRICIKAGTSEKGCCPEYGKPWVRVVEKPSYGDWNDRHRTKDELKKGNIGKAIPADYEVKTTGWRSDCDCGGEPVPCTVLDPFGGAGTTGLVADQLGRDCILIELNKEYAAMAEKRIREAAPMFAKVEMV